MGRGTLAAVSGQPASRHLGLIGGLGVGAAVIYYRALVAGCAERGLVPRMTIAHAHSPIALAYAGAGRIDDLGDYLAGFVRELEATGAELFAIPAVTPHVALPAIMRQVELPVVNMLEATAGRLRERGLSRVALFGTRFTIEGELFGALESFELVAPRPAEVDEIHRIYLELASDGRTSEANVETLRRIGRTICERDRAEAIVLAGTDLNLIFDEASAGFPALDCAAAHIDAILRYWTG